MVSQAVMECPVCYCNDATCSLVCGHSFCGQCIKEWWLKSDNECQGCPMCRRPIYFRGMKSKVEQWDGERREQVAERVYARVFDEIVEDIDDELSAGIAMFTLYAFDEQFAKMKYIDDISEEELFEMASNIFIDWITENPPPEFDEIRTFEHMLFVPKKKTAITHSLKTARVRSTRDSPIETWNVVIMV